MPTLPPAMLQLLAPFAPRFSRRVWCHALVLVVGTILVPGKRTVCAALRARGLRHTRQWTRYHRVLNRAKWSSRAVSRALLGLLVAAFVPTGPLIVGLDETIERRWGPQIAARGVYRDAVRSRKDYFVKGSGLRWVCLMLLVPLPWAGGVWARPFLRARAPAERHDRDQGRRHKQLTAWGRQLLLHVRRWLPERPLVAVADSGYAASALLACGARLRHPIAVVTRLRLDAALYDPAPPRRPGQQGRPRVKGARQPPLAARLADPATPWGALTLLNWYGAGPRAVETASDTAVWYHGGLPPVPPRWVRIRDPLGRCDTQALRCTDLTVDPAPILAWLILRWRREVTFAAVRRHLGVETQRQWSDLAILRTPPTLLGLFSLVTLAAHPHMARPADCVRQAAWYRTALPTCSAALALVRQECWGRMAFCLSTDAAEFVKVPRALVDRLVDALCYAA